MDFTSVAEAASNNFLEVTGFTNQASFLLNCDLHKIAVATQSEVQEINLLVSPAEMGELFKVMLLTKGLTVDAIGFSQFDKLHTL